MFASWSCSYGKEMYLKECLCKVVVFLINLLLFDVLVIVAVVDEALAVLRSQGSLSRKNPGCRLSRGSQTLGAKNKGLEGK